MILEFRGLITKNGYKVIQTLFAFLIYLLLLKMLVS